MNSFVLNSDSLIISHNFNGIVDFWKGMNNDKTFQNWKYAYLEGLFWQKGLVNDTIFLDYIYQTMPKREKINRKIVVGATDALTGEFVRFTERLGVHDLVYKAGRASTAMPGIFEYVEFENRTLVDGGVVLNVDIGGAIARCKESGFADKDIVIDIILCSGDVLPEADVANFNAAQMLYRYYQINEYQKTMIWISQGLALFPNVKFRYIVYPTVALSGYLPINFDPVHLAELMEKGRQDAKKAVEKGEGVAFKNLKTGFFNFDIASITKSIHRDNQDFIQESS